MKKYLLIFLILAANSYAYDFSKVNSLVVNGISNKYFPGAALIVGFKNEIVFEKYYGKFTYDENDASVTVNSIYDIASVTKVIATTSAAAAA